MKEAVKELGLSFSSVWRILCLDLKWKPYKLHMMNRLTPDNREKRETFCHFILSRLDVDGYLQKVIWTDEKFFVLHPAPNRQNVRIWAPFDPMETVSCRYQGDSKVMAWVALINGEALRVQWMEDDEGRNIRVTGDSYLHMLRTKVWPEIRQRARRQKWIWQQDGAPVHVGRATIEWLEETFEGRVISRNSDVEWPPYSPDLNPLDYFFWGYALAEVVRRKPDDLDELKGIVEEVVSNVAPEVVRAAVANLKRRAELCLESGGGHFEFAMD